MIYAQALRLITVSRINNSQTIKGNFAIFGNMVEIFGNQLPKNLIIGPAFFGPTEREKIKTIE